MKSSTPTKMNAALWRGTPMDILERMIDLEIAWHILPRWKPHDPCNPPQTCSLKTYALVCRQWAKKCAPVLYKHVFIDHTSSDEFWKFFRCLHADQCYIRDGASTVTIRVDCLETLIVQMDAFCLAQTEWDPVPMSAEWHLLLEGSYQWPRDPPFRNITTLTLLKWVLDDSYPLLQLIRFNPNLSRIILKDVCYQEPFKFYWAIDSETDDPYEIESDRVPRLTFDAVGQTLLSPLSRAYALAQRDDEDEHGRYSGLSLSRSRIQEKITRLWETYTSPTGDSRLIMRNSHYPNTWVISAIKYGTGERSCQLEFHVTQEYSGILSKFRQAWIRWIVFRTGGNSTSFFQTEAGNQKTWLKDLDKCLRGLSGLEKVVIETWDDEDTHVVTEKVVKELEKSRDKLLVWSREEALEYARRARDVDDTSPPRKAQLPISDPAAYELIPAAAAVKFSCSEVVRLLVE